MTNIYIYIPLTPTLCLEYTVISVNGEQEEHIQFHSIPINLILDWIPLFDYRHDY